MEALRIFGLICLTLNTAAAKICPGYCVPQELCTDNKGKVLGYCVDGRACCNARPAVNRSSCRSEAIWEGDSTHFYSPDYPGHSSGSLICPFDLRLEGDVVGIELELIRFELDAKELDISSGLKCDSDMFFIKGFSDWMTDPKCGNLNGYSILMDIESNEYPEKKVILLFITSSKEFRWKIKVHQIRRQKLKHSEACLFTRFAKWKGNKDFPRTLPVSEKPTSFRSDMEGSRQRWKWEVDIVSTDPKYAACTGQVNDSSVSNLYLHRICRGAIIDDRHVLTSASCFLQQPPLQNLRVTTSGLCPVESRSIRDHLQDILWVSIHYNYLPGLMGNDVAIIRTKRPMVFGDSVQPLPPAREPSSVMVHSQNKNRDDDRFFAFKLTLNSSKECVENLAKSLHLTSKSLNDLRKSHKYSKFLESLVCGPMNHSDSHHDDETCSDNLKSIAGYPLIGLNSSGGNPYLDAIFSIAFKTEVQPGSYYLPQSQATADGRTSQAQSAFLSYFTRISAFHNWILMAIS